MPGNEPTVVLGVLVFVPDMPQELFSLLCRVKASACFIVTTTFEMPRSAPGLISSLACCVQRCTYVPTPKRKHVGVLYRVFGFSMGA